MVVLFRFLMRITETIQIIPISRNVLYPGIAGDDPDGIRDCNLLTGIHYSRGFPARSED